jgi:hypothetical protein
MTKAKNGNPKSLHGFVLNFVLGYWDLFVIWSFGIWNFSLV